MKKMTVIAAVAALVAAVAGAGSVRADDATTKAARELQLGQNFEKGGKTKLALDHYKTVVKDYADTEAAKTAAARIKALEGK